jgi:hypothetical protein
MVHRPLWQTGRDELALLARAGQCKLAHPV